MTDREIELLFERNFPRWKISVDRSGAAVWVSMTGVKDYHVQLQITPNDGVGVSIGRINSGSDMGGHDEVFDNVEGAVAYVVEAIASI